MTGGARAGGPAMLTVRLVGEFEVARAGQPYPTAALGSRKARTLLKLLAVERGRMVTVDRLVETVWGDNPPARPVENVATLVSRLRSALGADCIVGGRDGYRLGSAPAVVVDLDQAAAQLRKAEQCLAARPDAAGIAAAHALSLLDRGSALIGDSYASWAEPARAEAAELLRRARHAAARAALATADPTTAAAAAQAAITADPVDEVGYRLLMQAFRPLASRLERWPRSSGFGKRSPRSWAPILRRRLGNSMSPSCVPRQPRVPQPQVLPVRPVEAVRMTDRGGVCSAPARR